MKQVNFLVKDESDFSEILDKVSALEEYGRASDVLALAMLGGMDKNLAESMARIHDQKKFKGKLAGFTCHSQIVDGTHNDEVDSVSFFIFESSRAKIFFEESSNSLILETAKNLSAFVNSTDDAVAMQLFLNSPELFEGQELFFDNLKFNRTDLPVVGGSAGVKFGTEHYADIFLFTAENGHAKIFRSAVLAFLYCGKNLFAKMNVELGWTPVGREHTITKMTAKNRVSEIDGKPVMDIYKHYFKMENNPAFTMNAMAFPWFFNYKGFQIVRGILNTYKEEDGSVSVVVSDSISEGDKFTFSFGSIKRIIEHSHEQATKLFCFCPESFFITVCDYRQMYLGIDEQTEIEAYKAVAPFMSGASAFGELALMGGKVRSLNFCMVILAMREGVLPDDKDLGYCKLPLIPKGDGHISPIDLMQSFLRVTSEEYAAARERELELEMQNQVQIERAANEAKSAFLSNMSHEIRTPINAVLGMNEMILREEKNPQILEYAENISSSGQALLSLVNDILDFSKIEAGKMEIILDEYSLSSLINDLFVMTKSKADAKGLSMVIQLDATLPDKLYGDMTRIRQVLLNILNNAVKYTEKGFVKFRISGEQENSETLKMTFHIIDSGIGMKKEAMSRLFSPFERIEEKRNRTIEGTGLGMAITKQLLEMMHSRLEVDSVYGKGSDFYFTIEQKVVDKSPIGDFAERAKENNRRRLSRGKFERFHAPDAKILVVDDTPMNLTVIKNLLKRTQVQVATAAGGRESVALSQNEKFDIIFMDHRMPDMDGTEAMKAIRALQEDKEFINAATPIIVLTANAVSGMREQFISDGFDNYLSKPVNSLELEDMVQKYLPPEKVLPVESGSESDEANFTGANGVQNGGANGADNAGGASGAIIPPGFFTVPGLDVASGVESSGGEEGYLNVVRQFVQTSASAAAEIEGFLNAGDFKNYTIKVHALKSSARLAGLLPLSKKAAHLESCGDNVASSENKKEILSKTPALLQEYLEACKKIGAVLAAAFPKEVGAKNLASLEEVRSAYEAIKECVAAFDFDSVDSIIKELDSREIPAEEKERFEKIKISAVKVDADSILELLAK